MTRLLRLTLLAATLAAPALLTVPASAASPTTSYEEVAAARTEGTQARTQHRQRRHTAHKQRRHRQVAHRSTRRTRPAAQS